MDDNERTIRLDEFKKMREELIKQMNFNQDSDNQNDIVDFNSGQSSSKVKSLNNGHYKESNSNFDYFNDRKAGMVNVLMLSIMTFVFECLFLFLSFMIYK